MAPSDLASAETCLAVGCGYDWLYDYLSAEERRKVREVLLRRGVRPYLDTVRSRNGWAGWQPHNWNSVVNGGTGVGALAVYDEEPEAAAALAYARKDIQRFLQTWPPGPFDRDGGYNEGVIRRSPVPFTLTVVP